MTRSRSCTSYINCGCGRLKLLKALFTSLPLEVVSNRALYYTGSYMKAGKAFDELIKIVSDKGTLIGLYYDDPKVRLNVWCHLVESNSLRRKFPLKSCAGLLVLLLQVRTMAKSALKGSILCSGRTNRAATELRASVGELGLQKEDNEADATLCLRAVQVRHASQSVAAANACLWCD